MTTPPAPKIRHSTERDPTKIRMVMDALLAIGRQPVTSDGTTSTTRPT